MIVNCSWQTFSLGKRFF